MVDKKHISELLAPAGGREQLEAAVRYGADAVYLACERFGLRQRAANFALADIPDAVAFAHGAGVRVYAALNALMDADDLAALPAYLEALAAAGIDAFIVSDLGALRLAQRHAPGVDLHVSTQASVSNAEAARVWHELGARRIVCAREMSIGDIAGLFRQAGRSSRKRRGRRKAGHAGRARARRFGPACGPTRPPAWRSRRSPMAPCAWPCRVAA